jgi:hypothetical protein
VAVYTVCGAVSVCLWLYIQCVVQWVCVCGCIYSVWCSECVFVAAYTVCGAVSVCLWLHIQSALNMDVIIWIYIYSGYVEYIYLIICCCNYWAGLACTGSQWATQRYLWCTPLWYHCEFAGYNIKLCKMHGTCIEIKHFAYLFQSATAINSFAHILKTIHSWTLDIVKFLYFLQLFSCHTTTQSAPNSHATG